MNNPFSFTCALWVFPGAKRNPRNKVEWGWEGSLQNKVKQAGRG
jgi:hypothetical protein